MISIVEWVDQEALTLCTLTLMPTSRTMMLEKGCSCSQDYRMVIREYSTALKAKEPNTTYLQQKQRQVRLFLLFER